MIPLLIALGGAAGSVARYLVGGLIQKATASGFPYGTLAVNVLGCLAIGILSAVLLNTQTHTQLRAALMVGFCGGFTTFSTFGLETAGLVSGGRMDLAAGYVTASVVGSLAATFAGIALGGLLTSR